MPTDRDTYALNLLLTGLRDELTTRQDQLSTLRRSRLTAPEDQAAAAEVEALLKNFLCDVEEAIQQLALK